MESVKSEAAEDMHALRVEVGELDAAKRELPKLVYESGLTMLKYEQVSASLEEVFIDLVGPESSP